MTDSLPDPQDDDARQRMLDLIRGLDAGQLANVHNAIFDALVSAARGEPSTYAINETVDLTQEEARRVCRKIGLDWDSGKMQRND